MPSTGSWAMATPSLRKPFSPEVGFRVPGSGFRVPGSGLRSELLTPNREHQLSGRRPPSPTTEPGPACRAGGMSNVERQMSNAAEPGTLNPEPRTLSVLFAFEFFEP